MAEYIKRNAIKARLEDLVDWCQDLRKPGLEQALAMLNEEPAADVAPVVRCRECKYYKPDEFECGCDFAGGLPYVKADNFCSYGERKEE